MPRVLREKIAPVAGASLIVVSFATLLRGAMKPDLDTKLKAMTLMWYGLHMLRCVLGPMRRHSDHWLVQYGAMAGFYLLFPLTVYAANTVRYTSDSSPDHAAWWAALVLRSYPWIPFGFSMKAFTLGDSPFRDYRILKTVFYSFLLINMIRPLSPGDAISAVEVIVIFLYLMSFLHTSANRLWRPHDVQAFALSLKKKVNSLSPFLDSDANSRYGPWVKVMGEDYLTESIIDGGTGDILLSHSFFKLLRRRYFGFHCAEEGNAMVRDFMLNKLMLPNYNRAFNIVEAQLALLHDRFFFTYATDSRFSEVMGSKMMLLMLSISCLALPVAMLLDLNRREVAAPFALNPFIAVVLLISLVIFLIEKEQLLSTDWSAIWAAHRTGRPCSNIPSRRDTLFRRPYWKNKIGQYSLIQDYDRCSVKKMSLVLIKQLTSGPSPGYIEHHPTEEDAVRLPDSVIKLVARTLRDINGPPTNGTRSLQRNKGRTVDDLSWTCREETHTHTILIWHIATCFCDMTPPNSYWLGNLRLVEISTSYEVATALSRYCGYLVAFLPEFLPEPKVRTQSLLQDVLKEAKQMLPMDQETGTTILQKAKGILGLRKQMSMEEKRTKIRGLKLPDEEAALTTFQKGVKLGQQLEKLNTLSRWKVMADFWAETILYIAPSDNVALHFEHLAKGGEFVTHLWAMLSNAGILKRASEEQDLACPCAWHCT